MIILLAILNQTIDFEDLFNKAATSLVDFQAVKDSAFQEYVRFIEDTLYQEEAIAFLITRFDTKRSQERHTIKNIMVKIGTPMIPYIAKSMAERGGDAESRRLKQALWILTEIGDEAIIEPVADYLGDEDWSVRAQAYTALGKTRSPRILPLLAKGLKDSVNIVRKTACYALGEVATQEDIDHLITGLDDEFYGVRYAAVKGLVHCGPAIYERLRGQLGRKKQRDYFIISAILQLDLTKDQLVEIGSWLKERPPWIRFRAYHEIDDRSVLAEFEAWEANTMLKNYLTEKIRRRSP